MHQRDQRWRNRGFTLPEVLIVVAILSIVAFLAVPGLVAGWRSMKLTELDETAREIYLSAQDETLQMKASGRLQTICAKAETDEGKSTQMVFSSADADENFEQTAALLSTTGGSYMMLVNPDSGIITDVYYSKSTDLEQQNVQQMLRLLANPEDICSSKNDEVRYHAGIGYYGGKQGTAASGEPESVVVPNYSVINQDDLYVKISVPELASKSWYDSNSVKAELTVTGEPHVLDGKTVRAKQTFTATGEEQVSEKNPNILAQTDAAGNYSLYVLLDSMTSGCSFAELCPNLVPGDDLTLSLSLSCKGTIICSNQIFAVVNSLFATKLVDVDSNTVTATCRYARQIRNLSAYCNAGNQRENADQEHVVLRLMTDIDFSKIGENDGIMPGNTAAHEYVSAALTGACADITLDGGGHVLANFCISGASNQKSSFSGLIGSCDQTITIQNLRIKDPVVSGDSNTGVLCGILSGKSAILNCRVYLSSGDDQGTRRADMATWIKSHMVSSKNDCAGGLVGLTTTHDVQFVNSFAAIQVLADNYAGGLLGKADGGTVTVSNCYASGNVSAKNAGAGGIIGIADNTKISVNKNTFTTSNISAPIDAAELIGALLEGSNASLETCTAYGIVTKGTVMTYGPMATGESETAANCSGLVQSGNRALIQDAYETDIIKREFSELKVEHPSAENSYIHPYTVSGTFPFALLSYTESKKTVIMPYFGDWPEEIQPVQTQLTEAGYLAYYEQYEDGSFGYYTVDRDGMPINQLNNKKVIQTTGYALLGDANRMKDVTVNGMSGNSITSYKIATITLDDGQQYYLYHMNGRGPTFKPISSWTKTVSVQLDDQTLWMNSTYAGLSASEDFGGTAENAFQIRTAAQLQSMMGDHTWYYSQTRDITATENTGNIGNNSGGFTFDGMDTAGVQWHIDGLRHPLFRSNSGTLKNIRLRAVQIQESVMAAALVLNGNTGTQSIIENCAADGTVWGGVSAAGLLWSAGGSISGCSFTGTVSTDFGISAGLILLVNYGGSVQKCHFNGTVSANSADGMASGFADLIQGSVENCYSVGTISASGDAAGFARSCRTVSKCFANCSVSSTEGNASGFTMQITQAPSAENCYSAGSVSAANGIATGFYQDGMGTISSCYSASEISGRKLYGFGIGSNSERTLHCYWLKDDTHNTSVESSGTGDHLTKAQLTAPEILQQIGFSSEIWTTVNGEYPYLQLKSNPHVS